MVSSIFDRARDFARHRARHESRARRADLVGQSGNDNGAVFVETREARSHDGRCIHCNAVEQPVAAEARDIAKLGPGLDAGVGAPDAVGDADLVCTCTTSPEPVLQGRLLRPGAHVNAVGAYTPETRELDDEAIRRARVVVETREVAMAEAGDVLIPLRAGVVGAEHVVADLAELVGGAPVRRGQDDVTVFVSVGVAFEDLVVAAAAVERIAP
jgi:ornithine cyclodeaminase